MMMARMNSGSQTWLEMAGNKDLQANYLPPTKKRNPALLLLPFKPQ